MARCDIKTVAEGKQNCLVIGPSLENNPFAIVVCSRPPNHDGIHHCHDPILGCVKVWKNAESKNGGKKIMTDSMVKDKVDEKADVIFGPCAECETPIKRAEKRKLRDGKWYHVACFTMPDSNGSSAATGDAAAIAGILSKYIQSNPSLDVESVERIVSEKFTALAAELPKPNILEIRREGAEPKQIKGTHKQFADLMELIAAREHVYLWGEPGTGKSTVTRQIAEALDLSWGYTSLNPQSPESRLVGFIDAGGTYRRPLFRDLYEKGGVFCIDEMDNSSPALLNTLNSLLENGHGAFPDGVIPRHADFVCVAAGNTSGRGGNRQYPERRAFDTAFLERFLSLNWEIDEDLEKSVTLAYNPKAAPWLKYVRELREHCRENHPALAVTPRASFKGAKLLRNKRFSVEAIAEMAIFKGFDRDSVSSIENQVSYPEVER